MTVAIELPKQEDVTSRYRPTPLLFELREPMSNNVP